MNGWCVHTRWAWLLHLNHRPRVVYRGIIVHNACIDKHANFRLMICIFFFILYLYFANCGVSNCEWGLNCAHNETEVMFKGLWFGLVARTSTRHHTNARVCANFSVCCCCSATFVCDDARGRSVWLDVKWLNMLICVKFARVDRKVPRTNLGASFVRLDLRLHAHFAATVCCCEAAGEWMRKLAQIEFHWINLHNFGNVVGLHNLHSIWIIGTQCEICCIIYSRLVFWYQVICVCRAVHEDDTNGRRFNFNKHSTKFY